MAESSGFNFNHIIRKIIEKSLFTERQVEILLKTKNIRDVQFGMSRGAYYRQVGQSKEKLAAFYYTAVLLHGLGVLLPDDLDVMSRLAEQVSVIESSDVFPERSEEVLDVIERVIKQACNV